MTLIESENTAICGSDMVRARRVWVEARKACQKARRDEEAAFQREFDEGLVAGWGSANIALRHASDVERSAYLALIRANDAFDASLGLKR